MREVDCKNVEAPSAGCCDSFLFLIKLENKSKNRYSTKYRETAVGFHIILQGKELQSRLKGAILHKFNKMIQKGKLTRYTRSL